MRLCWLEQFALKELLLPTAVQTHALFTRRITKLMYTAALRSLTGAESTADPTCAERLVKSPPRVPLPH